MLLFVCLSAIFSLATSCVDLLYVVDSQDEHSLERSVKVANDVGHLGLFLSVVTKKGPRVVANIAKNKADLIEKLHNIQGEYSQLLDGVTKEIPRRKHERPLIVLLFTDRDLPNELMSLWKQMKNSTLHVFRVGSYKKKEGLSSANLSSGLPFEQLIACSRKFRTMNEIRRRGPSTIFPMRREAKSSVNSLDDSGVTKRHPIFKGTTAISSTGLTTSPSLLKSTPRLVPIRVRNRFERKGPEIPIDSAKAVITTRPTKNQTKTGQQQQKLKPAGCLIDILFLVDFSKGTGEHSQNYFDIAASAVGVLPIGEDAVRVALIGYSGPGRATALFHFNKHDSKDELIEELFKMQQHGGTTRTAEAIRFAKKEFSNPRHGARIGAKRAIVLFTDGFSQDDAATAGEEARQEGIQIITVSVSDRFQPNIEELVAISGKKELVLISPNGQQIRDKILGQTCRLQ